MLRKLTHMLKKGEAGFTLIELMIVILVILILAAILVPQFGLAQERARKAKCVSNQRNLETSVAMWSTDNTSVIYTGGNFTVSTPSFTQLTSSPQYALSGAFAEPDDPAQSSSPTGVDYYLSQGSASGTPSASAPSYGHVACAADKVPDPWVNNYDGTAGTINNINHTRGASASP
jgi:prepilin-type N-terminal cleavage/methylation domain-containing protein